MTFPAAIEIEPKSYFVSVAANVLAGRDSTHAGLFTPGSGVAATITPARSTKPAVIIFFLCTNTLDVTVADLAGLSTESLDLTVAELANLFMETLDLTLAQLEIRNSRNRGST